MATFTISDNHFGHTNIIKHCNRPFTSVNEMNEFMVQEWNSVVKPDDTVIHVGDFAFRCNYEKLTGYIKRLNGYKILVRGNHDESAAKMLRAGFDKVYNQFVYNLDNTRFVLFEHIPDFRIENTYPYNYYVYGHTHNNAVLNKPVWAACACVEIIGYKPVLVEDLVRGLEDKQLGVIL